MTLSVCAASSSSCAIETAAVPAAGIRKIRQLQQDLRKKLEAKQKLLDKQFGEQNKRLAALS